MKKEDYDFLKSLQKELNTQDNQGTAGPLVWGVMESYDYLVPRDCGDESVICDSNSEYPYNIKDFVKDIEEEYIESELNSDIVDEWNRLDKEDIYEVVEFVNETYDAQYEIYDIKHDERLSRTTGSFLTKRAVEEYISRYGYNHKNPRPYCMCAYRNFELEHLLKIIKKLDIEKIPL